MKLTITAKEVMSVKNFGKSYVEAALITMSTIPGMPTLSEEELKELYGSQFEMMEKIEAITVPMYNGMVMLEKHQNGDLSIDVNDQLTCLYIDGMANNNRHVGKIYKCFVDIGVAVYGLVKAYMPLLKSATEAANADWVKVSEEADKLMGIDREELEKEKQAKAEARAKARAEAKAKE